MNLLASILLVCLFLGLAFICFSLLKGLFSDNTPIQIEKARFNLLLERYGKAIEFATQAIDLISMSKGKQKRKIWGNRQQIQALELRCYAYMGIKDYVSALSDAEMWVRLAPNNASAYYHRGTILLYLDELDMAKEDLLHVLDMSRNSYGLQNLTHHNLGLLYYIADDYPLSLHHYSKALENSSTAVTYVNIGIIHFRQDRMREAWEAYRAAEQIDASHNHVRMGLAVLYAAHGAWEKALDIWGSLDAQHFSFTDVDEVVEHYYRWTPPMADLVRQIAVRAKA